MRIRTLLLIGLLPLAACSAREDDNDADDLDFDATDWTAQLTERESSGITGSATARSVGMAGGSGTATSTVEIDGAIPGARHPWHVHSGTCATGGPIIGDADDYPILEPEADGSDQETAAIGTGMSDSQSYHVNVHRSPEDMTVIACGDLVD